MKKYFAIALLAQACGGYDYDDTYNSSCKGYNFKTSHGICVKLQESYPVTKEDIEVATDIVIAAMVDGNPEDFRDGGIIYDGIANRGINLVVSDGKQLNEFAGSLGVSDIGGAVISEGDNLPVYMEVEWFHNLVWSCLVHEMIHMFLSYDQYLPYGYHGYKNYFIQYEKEDYKSSVQYKAESELVEWLYLNNRPYNL